MPFTIEIAYPFLLLQSAKTTVQIPEDKNTAIFHPGKDLVSPLATEAAIIKPSHSHLVLYGQGFAHFMLHFNQELNSTQEKYLMLDIVHLILSRKIYINVLDKTRDPGGSERLELSSCVG